MQSNKNINIKKYMIVSKIVKYSLYTTVIGSILTIVLWFIISIFFSPKINMYFVKLATFVLSSGSIEPATISSITNKGMKYFITSKSIQNYIEGALENKDINFNEPSINITASNGDKILIESKMGQIKQKNGIVNLYKNVVITSNQGYRIYSESVSFNTKDSIIFSNETVTGEYNNTSFTAKGFEIKNNLNDLKIYGSINITIE